jgi:cysteinyl-tRNA synthetase
VRLTIGHQELAIVSKARVYVCGITPYDATHIGHAATFVWSDAAVRLLRRVGLDVHVTRNITDIDDELVARAQHDHTSWRSTAVQQTYRFEDDIARLGVLTPTFEPKAHEHVPDVIELTSALLEQGHAYERGGSVYFRGAPVIDACGLTRDEAMALLADRGGRLDDPDKDDALDAALWQRSIDDEPAWPSPWGAGRPGWHAECSAMALATLGTGIDLHCGGADLAFPHHAFEAAQVEAVLGVKPFARAWLRAGIVRVGGEKMAKSTGNLVFVRDVLEDWSPAALRLAVLQRRWWEDWDFDLAALPAAEARVRALRSAAAHSGTNDQATVLEALCDDLDVPRALEAAEASGGAAAELVIDVLGLRHSEHVRRTPLLPTP